MTTSSWTASTVNLTYFYHDYWNEVGDPRVINYLFMDGGPWSVFLVVSIYLIVINYIGPCFMKHRSPFQIERLILAHNVILIILNGWLFCEGFKVLNYGLEAWKCVPIDPTSNSPNDLYKIRLGWYFFVTKFYELLDTLFFVARKKYSHVSPLHVFHHSFVPIICWVGLKFAPGGNSGLFPLINSGIHTIMYTYYALSTLPSFRKYLWWKKHLTLLQIAQFIVLEMHSLYSSLRSDCQWPSMFIYSSLFFAFLFFILFVSFFRQTYGKSKLPDREYFQIVLNNTVDHEKFVNNFDCSPKECSMESKDKTD